MIPKDPRRVFQATNAACGLAGLATAVHALPPVSTLAAVTAAQVGLIAACLCPRCRWLGPNLTSVATTAPALALTFDDGPHPVLTPWIVATLAAYDARASFFCIGAHARRYPDVVRAVADAGHSIENHSDGHRYTFAASTPARMARDIGCAQTTLTQLCGTPPRFFRAPFGFRNPWLAPVLRTQALHYVSWSQRGFDTIESRPERIVARLTRTLAGGAILLLHDGHSAIDRSGQPVIYQALPALLERLAAARLRALDLPQLMATATPNACR